jgi:hypothetical protein
LPTPRADPSEADWFEPLLADLRAAGDSPTRLAEIFERLKTDLGAEEAGHRWWAAFGATDASNT